MTTNTLCLWFNIDAEEAAYFYAATFSDGKVHPNNGTVLAWD